MFQFELGKIQEVIRCVILRSLAEHEVKGQFEINSTIPWTEHKDMEVQIPNNCINNKIQDTEVYVNFILMHAVGTVRVQVTFDSIIFNTILP